MKTARAKRERNKRMSKNRKTSILLGAFLALWGLSLVLPPTSPAAPDSDGDGVANNRDLCDPTPVSERPYANADGCADRDLDGVYSYVDLCLNTTYGERLLVDADGCGPSEVDTDGDGYPGSADCDDTDAAVNPGAIEVCDGKDNNCDGTVDEGCGGGSADTDGDGFPDSEEQVGITLPAGMTLADGVTTSLPPCAAGMNRNLCVDWESLDVFVIVNRSTGCPASNSCGLPCSPLFDNDGVGGNESNIPLPASYPVSYAPFNPLSRVDATGSGGLGVTTHEVLQPGGGSQAIGSHFAVKINESLDPCTGTMLGISTPGVPGEGIQATVYSGNIIRWIGEVCNEVSVTDRKGVTTVYTPTHPEVTSFTCEDGISGESVSLPGGALETLYYRLIPNIIVHEFGHMVDLATGTEASAYHLPQAYGYFMEVSLDVKGTFKRGAVTQTMYISDDFHPDSQDGYQLK